MLIVHMALIWILDSMSVVKEREEIKNHIEVYQNTYS
jgi:hypothetical protein